MRSKFILTLAVVFGFSFHNISAQQTAKITSSGIGYLEYLPQNYSSNTSDYPVVIFLHGIKERGTTSTDPATLKSSVQRVANVGLPKYVKYGTQYPFILISPQLKSSYGTWPANYVMDVLNHVRKYLRINERRIYITGLSLGGYGTWTTLGAYPHIFAAAVPICSGGNALSKACAIAAENVPLWAFHGTSDGIVSYTVTTRMINAVNACTPKPSPLAKTTLFSGWGHNIWDKVYQQTSAINWMLGYINGSTSSTTNKLPVVSAGSDKALTLPTSSTYIQGSASDPDGSVASYRWTKIYGGTASMSGTTGSKLHAYNLVEGTYGFRLTVKDDKGATKYDDMKVTVSKSPTTNIVPIADAGNDRYTIYSSIILYGSGTDRDGKIVSYRWTQYGGAAATLSGVTSPKLKLLGLREGKYYLRLTVKDDKGAYDYDNVVLTVGKSSTTAFNAPTSSEDDRIASYKWTQYGDTGSTPLNAALPTVKFSNAGDRGYLKLELKEDDPAGNIALLHTNES